MIVIGVVGGIASGKSLVTSILQRFGARVIDADRLGHEVLQEPPIRQALEQRWGDTVFNKHDSREVNRQAVAEIVFAPGGEAEREFLEQLIHPRIRQRARGQLETYRAEGAAAVVLDAALLMEAKWDTLCDLVIFVDANRQQRRQRMAPRGWTDEQWRQREASQLPLEEKRRHADYVIDNSQTPEKTAEQLRTFWNQYVVEAPAEPQ